MSLYDETLNTIKSNKEVKESGKLLAIPFHRMPNLSKVLPGIRHSMYSIITSGTKQSKSQLCDFMFVFQPIEYLLANPECGMDIKILYFSLEMSREDKLAQAMSYRLFSEYNILINPTHLMSVFKGYTIESHILDILESVEFKTFFELFESKVEIIDNVKSPTSMMVKCEKYARDNGKVIYDEVTWEDGSVHKIIKDYVPNNPNQIVEVIADHATLFSEKGKTLYESIKMFSSEYAIKLKNKYKYSIVLIQQQNSDSTTQQFNNRGENILDKVRPTREGLTGCKD